MRNRKTTGQMSTHILKIWDWRGGIMMTMKTQADSYTHQFQNIFRIAYRRYATVELTQAINGLSVQELTAYTTLATVHRCIASKQLRYMADKLQLRTNEGNATFPLRHENTLRIQSRGGFFLQRFSTVQPTYSWPQIPDGTQNVQIATESLG